ncbi:hypothetical protein EMCRGX_G008177 [Ephydatia muelleri]
MGVKVAVGSQLTSDLRQSRPADLLVADWERGRPAAWDVTVTSPLTPAFLNEAGMTAGAAAAASEQRKHIANDPKCQELVPSPGLGLSLDPNEHQMAIKSWLGLNTSPGSPPCALCPEHPLDPLGHHAVTCKRGGDAISTHNKLRDVVLQTCHRACISAKAEASSGLGHELRNTCPADILASNWLCGKPAAFDLTVVSPLNTCMVEAQGRM